ncbi:MAG TPA: DUF971 domain-containing protein [Gemmatimonadales bacterium]|nr:DUF971 domain-containing protein [Gemmatimonadales bacterium]
MPRGIARLSEGLRIDWTPRSAASSEPDHVALYPARMLRLACPCAACVDEMSGRPLLDPARVPPDVHPLAVELVGGYGIRVRWSDGHSTGIYTFELLRAICPCDQCAAP